MSSPVPAKEVVSEKQHFMNSPIQCDEKSSSDDSQTNSKLHPMDTESPESKKNHDQREAVILSLRKQRSAQV